MKLVFDDGRDTPVQVGDVVKIRDGDVKITGIQKPHKPESTGRVYVTYVRMEEGTWRSNSPDGDACYFPSVVGAKWIEREDHDPDWNKDDLEEGGPTIREIANR